MTADRVDPEWTVLARVDRSRGRRGEVIATSFTGDPERIRQAGSLFLRGPGAAPETSGGVDLRIEEVWEHQGRLVLKFAGVDSIEHAERLRGWDVCIPRDRRLPAGDGEYHAADLVGCRMVDRSGREVGVVEDWQETGGPLLLRIAAPDGEILVPFARAICVEIEPEQGRIVVDLPEGLEELNRG